MISAPGQFISANHSNDSCKQYCKVSSEYDAIILAQFSQISLLCSNPYGCKKTLAEMNDQERKERIRRKSVSSFDEFSKWYKENK